MIFVKNAEVYATVWNSEVSENKKYMDLRISTSEKRDDEYENSGWFARAIGHALNSLKGVKERDRIKIKTFKMTNIYNKDDERSYLKMIILDAEILGEKNSCDNKPDDKKTATKKKDTKKKQDVQEESMPW